MSFYMDFSYFLQDTKYGSSPTSSSSSSVGGGPFNSSINSRGGAITDPSFPYFPPPFNPAFAAQFDVHAAASAIEHYPTFNYGNVNVHHHIMVLQVFISTFEYK